MGNKIGIEIDSSQFKLAYRQTDRNNIQFIKSLKSDFLVQEISKEEQSIFLFQCTREEFLNYPKSKNVAILREHYKDLLQGKQLLVYTNTESIKIMQDSQQLWGTFKKIVNRQAKLVRRIATETSLQAIRYLLDKGQFFEFETTNELNLLHEIGLGQDFELKSVKELPERFLMVSVKTGLSMYEVCKEKPITRLEGSIIGEKTLTSIINMTCPNEKLSKIIEDAFKKGNSLNVDLIVDDIYGKSAHNLGLPGKLIASSLGKYGNRKQNQQESSNDDIVRSLIISFAINVATLVSLGLRKYEVSTALVLTDKFNYTPFYNAIHSLMKKGYAPDRKLVFARNSPFLSCLGSLDYKK